MLSCFLAVLSGLRLSGLSDFSLESDVILQTGFALSAYLSVSPIAVLASLLENASYSERGPRGISNPLGRLYDELTLADSSVPPPDDPTKWLPRPECGVLATSVSRFRTYF